MFEQTFKNIDDVLWKEAGCTTELDYTEQTSWLLFLKYLDDLEQERALEAELVGKPYEFIIDEAHRWSSWAAPKKADGTVDHDNALDELKGANVTRGIVPIRFEQSIVVQAFGYYMLISKMTQDQIKEKTYGTALMQINIRDLKNILLSFPEQEEQQILVEKLDQVEKETQRLETIYRQKIAALNELKQSILQKAFTGELTADTPKTAKEEIAA
jgi:restriction endonuclease S subunit